MMINPSADISRKNPTDDFELLQRVGSGTYGDVYKARRNATNELAAIKVIKLEPGDDFSVIQQEIIMMKDCKHINIVAYFGSYLRRDKLWIAMEYCGGGSMQDIYHATGPLEEKLIAYVCKETLQGLAYLHSKQKMHRDIKGANILLTHDGHVKLADFGVSAQITQTIAKRKSFIGTPYWMAPEVAAVEKKGGYNQQCDVWAVGITAIEFAELQPPMFDLHPMRALFLMSKSNFVPPKLKDRQKWSNEFHSFLKSALQKNPKKRPPSDKILQHPFLTQDGLDSSLGAEVLRKVRDPQLTEPSNNTNTEEEDEEDMVIGVSKVRIRSSRGGEDRQHKTKSEAMMENVQFQPPLHRETEAEDGRWAQDQGQNNDNTLKQANDGVSRTLKPSVNVTGPPIPPKPKQYGVDYLGQSPNALGPPSRPPKDISLSTVPSRPPKPPPYNASYNMEGVGNMDEAPPIVPPRRRNSPALASRGAGGASDAPPPVRLPVRPSSRANEPVQDRFLSQPVAISRSSPAHVVNSNEDDDVTPTGSPSQGSATLVDRTNQNNAPSTIQNVINGLPPTPKVHMGACFTKVFNGCPLKINCASSWVHPDSHDQYLLFGADEGIYTLNLHELHENTMEQLFPRKCQWLYVISNVLMSISGNRNPQLYSHFLVGLHENAQRNQRIHLPDRMVPRRFAVSAKVPETKGCQRCSVVRNQYNGQKYLCAALQQSIVLLQWYEPMQKFLQLKTIDFPFPHPLRVFELLVVPDAEYPLVCYGVTLMNTPLSTGGKDTTQSIYQLNTLNMNSITSWFTDQPVGGTNLNVVNITQLEKDTLLICLERDVKIISMAGRLKSSRKLASELHFDFVTKNIVCLQDSILAFHEHGMQGKSFRNNEVTQEICDRSRIFRLLSCYRVIVLESKPTDNPKELSNLYILAGHEDNASSFS